jgi:hypothetical protein
VPYMAAVQEITGLRLAAERSVMPGIIHVMV